MTPASPHPHAESQQQPEIRPQQVGHWRLQQDGVEGISEDAGEGHQRERVRILRHGLVHALRMQHASVAYAKDGGEPRYPQQRCNEAAVCEDVEYVAVRGEAVSGNADRKGRELLHRLGREERSPQR